VSPTIENSPNAIFFYEISGVLPQGFGGGSEIEASESKEQQVVQ
jgi:hypothetical protein